MNFPVLCRHAKLLEEVLKVCQVPTDLFFPLGSKSRALILGEGIPEPTSSQNIGFEPPQIQYSDYLRQGTHSIYHTCTKILFFKKQDLSKLTTLMMEITKSRKTILKLTPFLKEQDLRLKVPRPLSNKFKTPVIPGPSLKEMITQSPSIDEIDRYAEQQGHDFGGSSYSVEDRNETGSPFHNARDSAATPHSSEYFNEEIEPEYDESNFEQGTLLHFLVTLFSHLLIITLFSHFLLILFSHFLILTLFVTHFKSHCLVTLFSLF